MTMAQQDTQVRRETGREARGRQEIGGAAPQREQAQPQYQMNVGRNERLVSAAAGAALSLFGLSRRSLPGLLVAGVGGVMLYRGATGHCPAYEQLGIDTAHDKNKSPEEQIAEHGIHVEQALLINKPAEQLYAFWHNFANLPKFMTHLDRVDVHDDRRSHWVARLTRMAGGHIEWDAEITADEPNRRIAWRSLPGSDIETTGEVRFEKALGDRGINMHVVMDFVPPAGAVAGMFPSLFDKATRRMMRTDLHRFKSLMEVGEILTLDGQPRGTCTGHGTRYREP